MLTSSAKAKLGAAIVLARHLLSEGKKREKEIGKIIRERLILS